MFWARVCWRIAVHRSAFRPSSHPTHPSSPTHIEYRHRSFVRSVRRSVGRWRRRRSLRHISECAAAALSLRHTHRRRRYAKPPTERASDASAAGQAAPRRAATRRLQSIDAKSDAPGRPVEAASARLSCIQRRSTRTTTDTHPTNHDGDDGRPPTSWIQRDSTSAVSGDGGSSGRWSPPSLYELRR